LKDSPSAAITSSTNYYPLTTVKTTKSPNKFSSQVCGKKGLKIEKRILGHFDEDDSNDEDRGETQFGEFPWMLALMKLNKATGRYEYKCGAVLIKNNVALTVTHCVGYVKYDLFISVFNVTWVSNFSKKNYAHNFKIRAGDWDRASTQEYLPHQDRTLTKIINHPHFYPGSLYNDLSILVWNEPLQYDVNVGNICLPTVFDSFDNEKCVVTGWGSAVFGEFSYSLAQKGK
jgi:Trypsin